MDVLGPVGVLTVGFPVGTDDAGFDGATGLDTTGAGEGEDVVETGTVVGAGTGVNVLGDDGAVVLVTGVGSGKSENFVTEDGFSGAGCVEPNKFCPVKLLRD